MRRITAILFTAILLVGCGGGGGGGGSSSRPIVMPPPTMTPEPPPAPPMVEAIDVQTADTDGILDAAGRAASSNPQFGSVWQSSTNVSGISSSFNGQRLTVGVSRHGKSPISLDTVDEIYDSGTGGSIVGLSGRSGRTWSTLGVTDNRATLATIAVDWADDDVNDYLAGGYWLHVEGDFTTGAITSVGIGAFVDGPEIDLSNPVAIPVQGTATYRGTGSGLYVGVYGNDVPGVAPGSAEVAEFTGIATLTADFQLRSIQGCVGCEGGLEASGIFEDGATGESYGFEGTADYQIRLGSAQISTNGFFSRNHVWVTGTGLPLVDSSGAWGGRFSSIQDADGDPRLVAGTFGGGFTSRGGTQATYLGAFGAGKQ